MREEHRAPVGLRAWLPHAVVVAAAIIIIIAAFLPWAEVGEQPYYGIGDPKFGVADGTLALILSLLAGIAAVTALSVRRGPVSIVRAVAGWVATGIGIILAAVGFADIGDIDDPANFSVPLPDGVDVAVGTGLWLAAIFGVVMALAGIAAILLRR